MHRGKPDGLEHFEHDDDCADFYHNIITYYKDTTGCFTITVKSNFSSFMTFFDVLTFPMSILCITGWDIYVFSHETSETVENIWLTNYFWSGPKKSVFLTISGL